jgi:cytidine deaminase
MDPAALLAEARQARTRAYAPYSRFFVGAAVLCEDGTVFIGCNVENASYGLSMCAERVAIGLAVAAGHQRFTAVAVVGTGPGPTPPCGACRQVIAEFAPDCPVYCAGDSGEALHTSMATLLPHQFNFQPPGPTEAPTPPVPPLAPDVETGRSAPG